MKKLIVSCLVSLILVTVLAVPAMADDFDGGSLSASVNVNTVVNITISGSISLSGDPDTVLGPATITIDVETDTNVYIDVGIMGNTLDTEITIGDWKWSTDSGSTKTSITGTYEEVAGDVDVGTSAVSIEHYVDTADASPGAHAATIYYKAVAADAGF